MAQTRVRLSFPEILEGTVLIILTVKSQGALQDSERV